MGRKWIIFLAILLLINSFFLLYSVYEKQNADNTISQQSKRIYELDRQVMLLEKQNKQQKQQIVKYEETISDLSDKLEILVTFKDAGFKTPDPVSDIRQLLELADNIPYGSPFKSGHTYTSMYGNRDESTFGGSPNGHHKGVDIVPKKWSDKTVRATAKGEIVDFGVSEVMGKYVVFETSSGYRLKYAHLNTIYWQDVENRTVKHVPISKGDKIGIMGNTGTWSTGEHLHLEIHVLDTETDTYKELNPWRIIEYIGGDYNNG